MSAVVPLRWTKIMLPNATPRGDTLLMMSNIDEEAQRSVKAGGWSTAGEPRLQRPAVYVANEREADIVLVCCLTNELLPQLLDTAVLRPRSPAQPYLVWMMGLWLDACLNGNYTAREIALQKYDGMTMSPNINRPASECRYLHRLLQVRKDVRFVGFDLSDHSHRQGRPLPGVVIPPMQKLLSRSPRRPTC